jgi:hypothetical protein
MDIRTADAGGADPYQNLVVAHLRFRDILEHETRAGFFLHKGFQVRYSGNRTLDGVMCV